MHTVTVTFDSAPEDVEAVVNVLSNVLPYIVDNVEINILVEGDSPFDDGMTISILAKGKDETEWEVIQ